MSKILKGPALTKNLTNLLNEIKNGSFAGVIHKNSSRKIGSNTSTNLQDICPGGKGSKMEVGCKVAMINGGTSGIGLATASQLLYSGARGVAITGHDVGKGKDAATLLNDLYGSGKAMYVHCNVNCMSQFDDAFKAVIEAFNRIDIVVNAVGIVDGGQWEREIVTNVVGTIRGSLLAFRYMGKEGLGTGGVVINISGVSGVEPLPAAPTLAASQHAIVGLSRSFGDKLHTDKSGIRIACLCPGFTKTSFLQKISLKGMTDRLGRELENTIMKAKKQKPDPCGQAVVHMIRHAQNGSVWLCEGSRLFLLNIPDRTTYAALIAQYM